MKNCCTCIDSQVKYNPLEHLSGHEDRVQSHSSVLKELIDAGVRSLYVTNNTDQWSFPIPRKRIKLHPSLRKARRKIRRILGTMLVSPQCVKDPCMGPCGSYFQGKGIRRQLETANSKFTVVFLGSNFNIFLHSRFICLCNIPCFFTK